MFSLGNPSIGIGLAITLEDRFSARAAAIAGEMKELRRTAIQTTREQLQMGAMASGAMLIAGGAVLNYMRKAVVANAHFEKSLMLAKQAMPGITDFELMRSQTVKFANETPFNLTQVSEAYLQAARAGLDFKQSTEMMGPAMRAALISGEALPLMMEKGTNIMTGFGHSASESTLRFAQMTTAINSSNMDFASYAKSLEYVTGNARLAGIEFEEISAIVGALHNVGLGGSKAGVALSNYISQLATALSKFKTTKQEGVLETIGLSKDDVVTQEGRFKNFIEIMNTVGKKMDTIGSPLERVPALKALFNERGGRAQLVTAVSSMGPQAMEIYNRLKDPRIIADARANEQAMMNSTWGQLEQLKSAVEGFRANVGAAITPLVHGLIKGLTKLVQVMSDFAGTSFGKFIIKTVAVAAILLTTFGAIGLVVSTIGLALLGWRSTIGGFVGILKTVAGYFSKILAARLAEQRITTGTFGSGPRAGQQYTKQGGRFIPNLVGSSLGSMYGMGFRELRRSPMLRFFARLTRYLGPLAGIFARLVPLFSALVPILSLLTGPVGIVAGIVAVTYWDEIMGFLKDFGFYAGKFLYTAIQLFASLLNPLNWGEIANRGFSGIYNKAGYDYDKMSGKHTGTPYENLDFDKATKLDNLLGVGVESPTTSTKLDNYNKELFTKLESAKASAARRNMPFDEATTRANIEAEINARARKQDSLRQVAVNVFLGPDKFVSESKVDSSAANFLFMAP